MSNESKCLPSTPLKLRSGLVLNTTNRESERSLEGDRAGIAAIEAEAVSTRAANCITPTEAVVTDTVDQTTAEVAVARHGQFKGRCNCT